MRLMIDRFACPLGELLLATDDEGCLRALDFDDHEGRMHHLLRLHYGPVDLRSGAAPAGVKIPLDAYFAGDVAALASVEVRTGGTDFQRRVWSALRGIQVGMTDTYGRIAAALGDPGASRAVGAANGANPIAISRSPV